MCLCIKSARYLLTYLDCCLFLFILIMLILSIYILLHIYNASSAPRCNAFILCEALWIVLYMKCATNKFDFDFSMSGYLSWLRGLSINARKMLCMVLYVS